MSSSDHAEILDLIITGRASTRAALVDATGLARGTLAERLTRLFEAGLLREGPETLSSGGGRPARRLRLNPDFGLILTLELGEAKVRAAITDLGPSILAETVAELDFSQAPGRVLDRCAAELDGLMPGVPGNGRPILGLGVSLSAPVDHRAGCVLGPSVLKGWDGFDIPRWFRSRYDAPAFIENDVNLLALAEQRTHWTHVDQFVFIKVGTGIGCGMMSGGHLNRGAQGASGDIGHIQLRGLDPPACRCGKLGCVEAWASGWAIARDLRAAGFVAHDARDVLTLVDAKVPQAIQLVEKAGRILGEAAANLVAVLNPDVVVIGGTLAKAGPHMMRGIVDTVHDRCLPLATRRLQIATARVDHHSGTIGAAHAVIGSRLAGKSLSTLATAAAKTG